MRIGPLELLDRALMLDGLGLIEHGEGMMCEGGRCEQSGRDPGKTECFNAHLYFPSVFRVRLFLASRARQ
jgi:hypothetical protein